MALSSASGRHDGKRRQRGDCRLTGLKVAGTPAHGDWIGINPLIFVKMIGRCSGRLMTIPTRVSGSRRRKVGRVSVRLSPGNQGSRLGLAINSSIRPRLWLVATFNKVSSATVTYVVASPYKSVAITAKTVSETAGETVSP